MTRACPRVSKSRFVEYKFHVKFANTKPLAPHECFDEGEDNSLINKSYAYTKYNYYDLSGLETIFDKIIEDYEVDKPRRWTEIDYNTEIKSGKNKGLIKGGVVYFHFRAPAGEQTRKLIETLCDKIQGITVGLGGMD
jgi:hypothetical protein